MKKELSEYEVSELQEIIKMLDIKIKEQDKKLYQIDLEIDKKESSLVRAALLEYFKSENVLLSKLKTNKKKISKVLKNKSVSKNRDKYIF